MDNQKLGIFITELRKEKGLTQAQLAQKLNVTDKAVSKWERGVGFPDIKLLEPLADVLDIRASAKNNRFRSRYHRCISKRD